MIFHQFYDKALNSLKKIDHFNAVNNKGKKEETKRKPNREIQPPSI